MSGDRTKKRAEQGSGAQDPFSWSSLFLLAFIFALCPEQAFADGKATSFGDIICNVRANGNGFNYILDVVAYIAGSFLAVRGVMLLKQHGENPNQSQVTKAVSMFVASAGLLSFPSFVAFLMKVVFGTLNAAGKTGCSPGDVASATGKGLDIIMQNLVKNIYSPMFSLLSMISVMLGLLLIFRGLMRAAKNGSDPKMADPKAIVGSLVIGAALVSTSTIMGDVLKSIFGVEDVSNMSNFVGINWSTVTGSGTDTSAVDKTVKAVLAFVQIIGGISFVRGWLILKAVFEGGQGTVPQATTHIIGGAMAINIDKMLQIMDKTFGTGILNA